MEVHTKPYDDATVVVASGDVDGSTAPALQEQVLAIAQPGCRLLLAFSLVSFMSSAGLRVMLLLHRQISDGRGRAVIVGLNEEVKFSMSVTGFLKFFTTADTFEAGIVALDRDSW